METRKVSWAINRQVYKYVGGSWKQRYGWDVLGKHIQEEEKSSPPCVLCWKYFGLAIQHSLIWLLDRIPHVSSGLPPLLTLTASDWGWHLCGCQSHSMGGHVTRHANWLDYGGLSDWSVGENVNENRLLVVRNRIYIWTVGGNFFSSGHESGWCQLKVIGSHPKLSENESNTKEARAKRWKGTVMTKISPPCSA